jgi:dynein heavy chain
MYFQKKHSFLVDEDSAPDDNPVSKAFASGGLNSNKNLKNYDCWEDDKTPQ